MAPKKKTRTFPWWHKRRGNKSLSRSEEKLRQKLSLASSDFGKIYPRVNFSAAPAATTTPLPEFRVQKKITELGDSFIDSTNKAIESFTWVLVILFILFMLGVALNVVYWIRHRIRHWFRGSNSEKPSRSDEERRIDEERRVESDKQQKEETRRKMELEKKKQACAQFTDADACTHNPTPYYCAWDAHATPSCTLNE